jgi:hypothetical protein
MRKASPRKGKAKAKPAVRTKAKPAARAKPKAAPPKHYKLVAGDLRPLAEGYGACIASDKITVDGNPLRFMYREPAIHHEDSGWRFFSGLESDTYLRDSANLEFFDCNTIANFDRTIVPLLAAPVGSAFRKRAGEAEFAPVPDWTPPKD